LLERVNKAVSHADHPALAPTRDAINTYAEEAQQAAAYVAAAPKDVSRLHPRRVTRFLANLLSGALLVEQAAWELKTRGSARKAAVARLYANVHMVPTTLGGIGRDDQIILDGSEAIVGYGELDPDRLLTLVA